MPFTLAHPIGALPFKLISRRLFSTTGLVVGSMAPDYEYFMKQTPSPTLSETTFGVFFFDLPLAILVTLVFHLLVKRPLIRHLPQPYNLRYSGYAEQSFLSYLGKHWLVFLSSLMIGIGSHLLLDWLTSPISGPFAIASLTEPATIGPLSVPPLVLSERLFSILGMIALIYLLSRLNKPSACFKGTSILNKWVYWSLFIATLAALMLWEWQQVGGFEGFAKVITTLIWAVVSGLVVASVMIRLLERFQPGG